MDRIINIAYPILLPSNQGIRVEYKLTSAPTYTLFGVVTTNTFIITGLTAGACYNYRFTFLQSISPLIECSPVVQTDCLPPDVPCPTIEGELVPVAGSNVINLEINIDYTPSPYVEPCGGFKVYYGLIGSPQGPLTTILLPTLAGVTLPLVVPNVTDGTYYVAVYSLDCQGNQTFCDDVTIPPLSRGCIHASVTAIVITNAEGDYFVQLTVVPTVPITPVYYVSYFQDNTVNAGVNDPGGVISFASTGANPEIFTIPVSPNTNVVGGLIKYAGSLIDGCNFSTKWYATE